MIEKRKDKEGSITRCDICNAIIFDSSIHVGNINDQFGTCDICGRYCCSEHTTNEKCYINAFEEVCTECEEKGKDIIQRLKVLAEEKEVLIKDWCERSGK